jgi:hypothetical protein
MLGRRSRPAEKGCYVTSWSLKNMPNLKTPAGTVFSPGHPTPRRRETYRPSIHILNFTYEDDHKINFKYVAGTVQYSMYIY